jgi:hypothetical protein
MGDIMLLLIKGLYSIDTDVDGCLSSFTFASCNHPLVHTANLVNAEPFISMVNGKLIKSLIESSFDNVTIGMGVPDVEISLYTD